MVENEYAKAVYELALEENKKDEFSKCFDAVVSTTTQNQDFMKILTSPFIEKKNKKDVINNVYKSLDETFINFLYVLIDHNRFGKIKDIADCYASLVLEDKNIVKVEVHSANTLNDNQLDKIEQSLNVRYKDKKLELINIVNPDLIGGLQIVANGEVIDLSLKSSLTRLKESL